MKNKDLFRLEHIRDSIEKIEYLARTLHTQDNFEKISLLSRGCRVNPIILTGLASAQQRTQQRGAVPLCCIYYMLTVILFLQAI